MSFGYWRQYEGLLPQHVFGHINEYMHVLEGMFRALSGTVRRDDRELLNALDGVIRSVPSKDFVREMRSNCTWDKGNSLLERGRRGRQAPPRDANAEEETMPPSAPDVSLLSQSVPVVPAFPDDIDVPNHAWYIRTAQAIARTGTTLIRRLEMGKVISYFSEWCAQEVRRTPGVAFQDCVVVYDRNGENVTFLKTRSPAENIYRGIRHNLLTGVDHVLQAAVDRVTLACQQTFWAIPKAFLFGRACQALAKRGCNINAITLYLGAGGVGLSRYSAHLDAMYGPENHVFFDPNVFYDDSELRKVIQLLAGRFIYTGQEKPTNTRNGMRQDLVKKCATGEGIAGRMPYGILTKLFHILGWKRLEMNKRLVFSVVPLPEDMSSILGSMRLSCEPSYIGKGGPLPPSFHSMKTISRRSGIPCMSRLSGLEKR